MLRTAAVCTPRPILAPSGTIAWLARFGTPWAFALNAVSFATMIVVLARWHRAVPAASLPPETFGAGLRAGLRYAARGVYMVILDQDHIEEPLSVIEAPAHSDSVFRKRSIAW